ncbi:MAG TPA: amino acid permease, partial [Pseudogulbenkiania sp.]|nr:amino acid permease [Pseudogulbenkiania sp.]
MLSAAQTSQGLRKELSAFDLTMLGIGAIIGTGIFVLTGTGATVAGPGLVLSFVIGAIACGFAALCYAEFASMLPVSGSTYTYAYATLGEIIAWIIGWDLMLEYLLASSAVSVGWSGYFQSLIAGFGLHLPDALTAAAGARPGVETVFNLPAFVIAMLITSLLAFGIKESKRVNNVVVLIKVAVVLLFIVIAVWHVKPANWNPALPYGMTGVFHGAAIVFFSFLGFDAVTCAAEEVKNPEKDIPKGVIWSLAVCSVLYVIVSAIMTGIVPFVQFKGIDHPVSLALQVAKLDWFAGFVDLGAILGMLTVILVMTYGQTRILFAMSR